MGVISTLKASESLCLLIFCKVNNFPSVMWLKNKIIRKTWQHFTPALRLLSLHIVQKRFNSNFTQILLAEQYFQNELNCDISSTFLNMDQLNKVVLIRNLNRRYFWPFFYYTYIRITCIYYNDFPKLHEKQ